MAARKTHRRGPAARFDWLVRRVPMTARQFVRRLRAVCSVRALPDGASYPQGALTPSSVAEGLRCGAQLFFRRIARVPTEDSTSRRWRRILRAATAAYASVMLDTSTPEDTEPVAQRARSAGLTAARATLQLADGEVTPAFNDVLDKLMDVLEKRSWTSGTIVAAGERYVVEIPDIGPLVGDSGLVVERDGEPVVILFGIGRNTEEALERADRDSSITGACIAYQLATGRPVRKAELHLLATDGMRIAIVPTTRGPEAMQRFLASARVVSRRISLGEFAPADDARVCSLCSYASACGNQYGRLTA